MRKDQKFWTEEEEWELRKLWIGGFSASQISKSLNCGYSRNAVIGKIHRLNLPPASIFLTGPASWGTKAKNRADPGHVWPQEPQASSLQRRCQRSQDTRGTAQGDLGAGQQVLPLARGRPKEARFLLLRGAKGKESSLLPHPFIPRHTA